MECAAWVCADGGGGVDFGGGYESGDIEGVRRRGRSGGRMRFEEDALAADSLMWWMFHAEPFA